MHTALENIYKIIDSIDLLVDNGQEMSSLILLYSGIDIVSSFLVSGIKGTERSYFIKWTNKYLIPKLDSKCSAEDLYGARCAILHTMWADSKLFEKGEAKRICYEWGNIRSESQEKLLDSLNFNEQRIILLQGEDLIRAFEEAFEEFIKENRDDPEFVDNFNRRSLKMFGEF